MAVNKDKAGLSVREETIGRLYALRAGLSTVAREKEIADSIMEQAKKAKKLKIAKADMRVKTAENDLARLKKDRQSTEADIMYVRTKANSQGLPVRIIAYLFIGFMWLLAIAPLGYGAAHICCRCGLFVKDWNKNPILNGLFTWTMFNSFLTIAVFVVAAVILAVIAHRVTRKITREFTFSYSERKKARRQMADYEERIRAQEKSIDNAREDLEKAKVQRMSDIQDADAHMASEKKKATEHAMAGLAVLKAVEESFSDMIDQRDWGNIDVLIYALETHRAENMKEALGIVDNERRTSQIVSAVNDAGKAIGKSINGGLRNLQGTMTQHFQKLGDAVVSQGDRIAGHVKDISIEIADNSNYVQQLASQVSMNNALREKSNENAQMLADKIEDARRDFAEARATYSAY